MAKFLGKNLINFNLNKFKMETKLQLTHPQGKKAIKMDKSKYELLKKALLKYLKTNGDASHTEMWKSIEKDFKKNKIKFEGSLQWHLEWVKLDLEANKFITRVPESSPIIYTIKKGR